jgi:SAM-dependent methyltransferase
LDVKLTDLPARTRYLAADPETVVRWSTRLGQRDRPRIGLAWAGRPDHARDQERSMQLIQLQELLAHPGVDWISLQSGASRLEITASGMPLRDFGGELRDFHETAALIENLDLVVAVDTAVAHLAGAMGKPVWILLPHVPDWRWLLERDDSPWYPSARLFRQRLRGDWASVIGDVHAELLARFPVDISKPAATPVLPRASSEPPACKVCGQPSDRLGAVDFAKNCLDPAATRTRLSGIAVEYFRCGNCGLLFTPAFDHWDKPRFLSEIYNDEYPAVDPDYVDARPRANAQFVVTLLRGTADFRILDYGGGNDRFAQLLRGAGFDCLSWDPLRATAQSPRARGSCDLVTAFEVFEHSPTPRETFAEASSFLNENGALIFSTLVVEPDQSQGINHWYVAPRNGHVTIFSRQALAEMAGRAGLTVWHINDDLHVAWQQRPLWLDLARLHQPLAMAGT